MNEVMMVVILIHHELDYLTRTCGVAHCTDQRQVEHFDPKT
jgi:hypothetical protein